MMSMNNVFLLSNAYILPWWVLMIAFPNAAITKRVMASVWVVSPLLVSYAILVLPGFLALIPTLLYPQLADLVRLFGTPQGTTVAWIHLISFDLWVGRWVYFDSHDYRIPTWLRRIFLVCILMAGPFGLLVYLTVRRNYKATP